MGPEREARIAGSGERRARWAVIAPPMLFLCLFFVLPGLIMVLASFREPGEFGGLSPLRMPDGRIDVGIDTYAFFFSDWVYAWIFLRSLIVAAITTLICLALAYPLALLIAKSPRGRRDFLVLLVILPFAANFLIRIYAWIILLGPFDLLYSPVAVIIAMVYVHLPFMVLPLYTNLEKHDPAWLEAARDLGANAWTRFWRITFPLSLPGVYSGAALVFIPVLGMFAIPELVGGTGDVLAGNLIKGQFLDTRDWPMGAMLSIVLTLLVLLLAGLSARAGRMRRREA